MLRLLVLVLVAPFWVHFVLAGGVTAFSYHLHDQEAKGYAEKLRLAEAAPPEVMSITAFHSDAPRTMPVEVNLRAQIAIEHNVQLIRTKNGKTVSERSMYILVDADAVDGDKRAYGAVVLGPSQVDAFAEWAVQQMALPDSEGAMGPILTIPGLIDWPSDTSHIMEAIENRGFTPAKKMVFVEPFLEGRAAGLAISKRDEPLNVIYFYSVAGFFVLLGLLKFALRMRKGAKPVAAAAPAPAPAPAPAAMQARTPVPVAATLPETPEPMRVVAPVNADNDFIGALARKRLAAAEPVAAPSKMPPAIVSSSGLGDKLAGAVGTRLGGLARKVGSVAAALVLYLLVMNFSGSLGLPLAVSQMGAKNPQAETPVAMEMAPVSVAEGLAEVIVLEPIAPVGAVGDSPIEPAAAILAPQIKAALVSGMFADAGGEVKAQLLLWQAAPPLWLVAGILAVLVLLPALVLLRGLVWKSTTHKGQKLDPFERLLQRRLAEQARVQHKAMGA